MKGIIIIVLFGAIILFSAVLVAGWQLKPFQNLRHADVDADVSDNQLTLESQKSEDGPVAVSITPKKLSDKSDVWIFEVSLDTHSTELNYDLTQLAVLIDDKGNKYKPLSWQGDPPSGHHRSGSLSFPAISPLPNSFTLKIFNIGGIQKRTFLWQSNL